MPTYEFTVALDRAPDDDDFDRLFEAGLDDTTPETRDGHGVLNVAREAATMSAAILTVVRDVERAGFRAVGIEDDDLVSLKTIAQRTGRSYESLRLLASGKRGPGGFPEPLSGDGWALYSWALVADWYSRNYGADQVPAVTDDQRVLAAASLMLRAVETAGTAVSDLLALVSYTVAPRAAGICTAVSAAASSRDTHAMDRTARTVTGAMGETRTVTDAMGETALCIWSAPIVLHHDDARPRYEWIPGLISGAVQRGSAVAGAVEPDRAAGAGAVG